MSRGQGSPWPLVSLPCLGGGVKGMKILFAFLCFVFLFTAYSHSMDLSHSGGPWSVTFDASSLAGGPGSKLGEIQSPSETYSLSVSGINGCSKMWWINVSRDAGSWPENNMGRLYIRRVSDGTGKCPIADGFSWMEITSASQLFFSGIGDRSDVLIQYKFVPDVLMQSGLETTSVLFSVQSSQRKGGMKSCGEKSCGREHCKEHSD